MRARAEPSPLSLGGGQRGFVEEAPAPSCGSWDPFSERAEKRACRGRRSAETRFALRSPQDSRSLFRLPPWRPHPPRPLLTQPSAVLRHSQVPRLSAGTAAAVARLVFLT